MENKDEKMLKWRMLNLEIMSKINTEKRNV